MTCTGCSSKVKESLEAIDQVNKAEVDHQSGRAELELSDSVSNNALAEALSRAGSYYLEEKPVQKEPPPFPEIKKKSESDLPEVSVTTYKPLIIIVLFIAGFSFLAQWPISSFDGNLFMRHFMAGFFVVFSFFKLINIRGFADSYRMYDWIAGKFPVWGLIYPFVELSLGVFYWIDAYPTITNWVTVVILGVSSAGVIESNLNRRKIKCACLGDVFKLPMSTVTIIEDLTMVAMAVWMLIVR